VELMREGRCLCRAPDQQNEGEPVHPL
jgi:hypothetical protein